MKETGSEFSLRRTAAELLPLRIRHAAQDVSNCLAKTIAKKPSFVIIGTGRCGTKFVAEYLTAAGHPCGHESFYGPNGPRYRAGRNVFTSRGDSSWLAVPHLPEQGIRVIHQTRAPLPVIKSFLKLGFFHPEHYARHRRFVEFARRHFEFSADPLRSAVRWYVEWNEKCLAVTDKQFRLEDFHESTDRISEWLGFDEPMPKQCLPGDPNAKVSRIHVSDDQIQTGITCVPEYTRLVDLSARLGYAL